MYIRKLKSGKWYVEINKKGFPRLQKSFLDKPTARNWARKIELQMDKNIFEDYSGAAGTTLKALLIKYRDEITSKKRGVREETSKINYLIRHKIALNSLMRLRSHHIYKLKTELSLTRGALLIAEGIRYRDSYCPCASICKPFSSSVIADFICLRLSITNLLNDLSICIFVLAILSSVNLKLIAGTTGCSVNI